MVVLQKFTEADFDRLISWINSEEDLIQFAGPLFKYPLTHAQLQDYLTQTKKQPYRVVLAGTNEVIGHCELNFEKEIPRLSRILIGEPAQRNKGLGKHIVKAMTEMVFHTTSHTAIDLNVFDWNLNAIACYKKLGFDIRPGLETTMTVAGKEWKAFNMVLYKVDMRYEM